MTRIKELEREVHKILLESGSVFAHYQRDTNLNCIEGCGACCLGTEISATPLEMLPAAMNLLGNGMANTYLKILDDEKNTQCIFYHKLSSDGQKGQCTNYLYRPCVCRSFGAAAVRDKFGVNSLSVCSKIKTQHPEAYEQAKTTTENAPYIGQFANQVNGLDPNLSRKLMPINLALKEMLEKLLYLYELDPASFAGLKKIN